MKRLVLKQWVKDTLVMIPIIVMVVAGTLVYMNRIEKISTGEMVMQYEGE